MSYHPSQQHTFTEISEDEMAVLKERARRMLLNLREDRPVATVDQLRRWRMARLESLGLGVDG